MRTALVASALALCLTSALSQRSDIVREADPQTGTKLRQTISKATLYPLTKTWFEFTPEEKARLRQFYETMGENDEPPFPIDGLGEITRELAARAGRLNYQGELSIHVTVDATGRAKSIDFVKYVDFEAAKSLAYVLVKTKYKPALCAGVPCEMQFPFYFTLVLR